MKPLNFDFSYYGSDPMIIKRRHFISHYYRDPSEITANVVISSRVSTFPVMIAEINQRCHEQN